jgi:predicted transcriptional regulator
MKGGRVPRRGFGELEQTIMEVIWAHEGAVTGRQVVDELAHSRRVAYTTVLTVMDRLVRKGLLVKQATGRAHSYRPVESREAYTANLMAKMLGTANNPTAVLLHFVEQLPPEHTDELRSALHTDPESTREGMQ